jgi:deoxyribonuclease-4
MPYLPNLSGPPGELYERSVKTLTEEIERCDLLGISHLVIHLGSHMGRGSKSGIDQLINALRATAASLPSKTENKVVVLLENNVGQKNTVGSALEELRLILDRLDSPKQFGVCIDTCHLFASGFEKIKAIVGLKELKIVHLNDSKGGLGSNLDRHEHIGLGSIGAEGIAAFLNHRAIQNLPIIMETPIDAIRGDEENLRVVLDMIKK